MRYTKSISSQKIPKPSQNDSQAIKCRESITARARTAQTFCKHNHSGIWESHIPNNKFGSARYLLQDDHELKVVQQCNPYVIAVVKLQALTLFWYFLTVKLAIKPTTNYFKNIFTKQLVNSRESQKKAISGFRHCSENKVTEVSFSYPTPSS